MNIGSTSFNPASMLGTTVSTYGAALGSVATTLGGVKGAADEAFIGALGVRVPTTTEEIGEERRNQILSTIQPGDIMLETDNAYPGWQRLEFFTMQSDYTHAAIYEGNGKFIEATPPKVCRTDLSEYLHGNLQVCIIRPPYKSPQDLQAALDYCRASIGKPYNNAFKMGSGDSLYCAEMVYNAMKAMPNPIDVPLKTALGRPAVAPDSFLDMAGSKRVYDDGASFWKNQASHWPVAAGAVATSGVAWSLGGPIAGTIGFVGGLALSICVGNKMQTGHFNFAGADPKK